MATDKINLHIDNNLDDIVKVVKNLTVSMKKMYEGIIKSNKSLADNKEIKDLIDSFDDLNEKLEETSEAEKKAKKESDSLKAALIAQDKARDKAKEDFNKLNGAVRSAYGSMKAMIPISLGLGIGLGGAIDSAMDLVKILNDLRVEMAYLSDASGNTGAAIASMYDIAGGGGVSRTTAKNIMTGLNTQGVELGKTFNELGKLTGQLSLATGIQATEWASLTGEMSFNYGIPEDGIKNIASAMVGTGIKGTRLQTVMKTVNKVFQDTAFLAGKTNPKAMEATAKSVLAASVVFNKLGVSVQTASSFMEGIMNPENYEKNAFMFSKMGISAAEYAGYLNDANGQQKLLQRTMKNLPGLANEISNISNPFARMDFAKSLGLPMELVSKFAGKTSAEISQLMEEYQKANKKDEALKKKREQMATETAKIDDALQDLKIKALGPLIKMITNNMPTFIKIMNSVAEVLQTWFAALAPHIEEITNFMVGAAKWAVTIFKGLMKVLKPLMDALSYMFLTTENVKDKNGNVKQETNISTFGKIAGGLFAAYMINKAVKGFGGKKVQDATVDELANAIAEAQNNPESPLSFLEKIKNSMETLSGKWSKFLPALKGFFVGPSSVFVRLLNFSLRIFNVLRTMITIIRSIFTVANMMAVLLNPYVWVAILVAAIVGSIGWLGAKKESSKKEAKTLSKIEEQRSAKASQNLSDAWDLEGEWGLLWSSIIQKVSIVFDQWFMNPIRVFFRNFMKGLYSILQWIGEKTSWAGGDKLRDWAKSGLDAYDKEAEQAQKMEAELKIDNKKSYSDSEIKGLENKLKEYEGKAPTYIVDNYKSMIAQLKLSNQISKAKAEQDAKRHKESMGALGGINENTKKETPPPTPNVEPNFYELAMRSGYVIG